MEQPKEITELQAGILKSRPGKRIEITTDPPMTKGGIWLVDFRYALARVSVEYRSNGTPKFTVLTDDKPDSVYDDIAAAIATIGARLTNGVTVPRSDGWVIHIKVEDDYTDVMECGLQQRLFVKHDRYQSRPVRGYEINCQGCIDVCRAKGREFV
jgi:hypothetical protein